jgi:hypothetical protein
MALNMSPNASFGEMMSNLTDRLSSLEQRFSDVGFDMKTFVKSEVAKKWKVEPQASTMFGLSFALCVDTIDPWKQNRVRYYTPMLIKPDTPIKSLPFASPVSSMGGFDDCGLNWVPPAGSQLALMFEAGYRYSAYYLGTTWTRDRGQGQRNFGYNIEEFYKYHEGHRTGYYLGANDGSQVFPQWNTENYNGKDIDSLTDYENDSQAQKKITIPHIYGFKTVDKHMLKMDDGDPKCARRWKHLELMSGDGGGWMCFKDDHLRPVGQWANPKCCGGGDLSDCSENPDKDCEDVKKKPKCSNPYFKHENECRPYKGPGTPQNNKADLPQSGIQFLTRSGHTKVMDDSVDQPQGIVGWERSKEPFDFGCNDLYKGKMYEKSATGHEFLMDDDESDPNVRSDKNGIKLLTASGNRIQLNDHTIKSGSGGTKLAGKKRGIELETTSTHIIQMIDEDNEQSSPDRAEGGVPVNKAKKAYIRIRTGYGLQILMNDANSQEETQKQHIQIWSPQWDNTERGPHILHFQEVPSGPGEVYLRVGGNYVTQVYDEMFTGVGEEENPNSKITIVTRDDIHITTSFHYHEAKYHYFRAENEIYLDAGPKDCETEEGDEASCMYNVVINRCAIPCPIFRNILHYTPGRSTAEHVFASGLSEKTACG